MLFRNIGGGCCYRCPNKGRPKESTSLYKRIVKVLSRKRFPLSFCIPPVQIYEDIANDALSDPTTARQMTGEAAYEIARNLAMDIFSSSSAPLTSARATSLLAGGPVGMSINTNHWIGSFSIQLVLSAIKNIVPMLMLSRV
jgi:hypothetical protein